MLRVRDLSVRYPGFTLGPIDLEVPSGSFLSLIGPNGSGKSTLIRGLLGLRELSSGDSSWEGADLQRRLPATLAQVGYVSDSSEDLLEEFTAPEYWQYCRVAHEAAREERLPHLIERAVDLAQLLDFPVSSVKPLGAMSFGTRRKAQIIATLMVRPRLLVMDEVFGGLDFVASRALEGVLRDEVSRGVTVVSSNHDLDLASRLSDSVAVLHEGSLVLRRGLAELGGHDGVEGAIVEALQAAQSGAA